jgi:putative ABC transport system permease protein
MTKHLYLKLAITNIRKNGRFYVPFLITCVATVAMFFIMCCMTKSKSLPGGRSLADIMFFGSVVIAIFSTIFLFYTNSFLIKRRKKELGLYNILGMEKRHIARVLFLETVLSALISIIGGLISGIVLNRLMFLILLNLMHSGVDFKYEFDFSPVSITIVLFCLIFFLILISNLIQIKKANPIELLRSASTGEKEPKSKWPLVVIGLATLAAGYYLAVTTKNVIAAIPIFFLAVLLVIIGTYCLFAAGSITVLKIMKRNKSYYYKPKHFVSVSGMLYRMKQNAVGLANICILSTTVLVIVSTTVSLYSGMENILNTRFPTDISIKISNPTEQNKQAQTDAINNVSKKLNLNIENFQSFDNLTVSFSQDGNKFIADTSNNHIGAILVITTQENYKALTGKTLNLSGNDTALYVYSGSLDNSFRLLDETYNVKNRLSSFPNSDKYSCYACNVYYIVVSGDDVMNNIYKGQLAAYGKEASQINCETSFDVTGTDDDALKFFKALSADFKNIPAIVENRQISETSFYQFYGRFLFLGIFLGLLFLMATVLIIYYKQIIEGFDDRANFEILQKVGMSNKLIASSVRSQILTMFSLPLVTAVIHLCFAFPLLTRLLKLLNLTDVSLFLICTIGTVLAFAVIYALVYSITAKTYYRIVSNAN